MTDTPQVEALSATEAITAATVRLLNHSGVGSVTVESICAAANVTILEFARHYRSERSVFADIVRQLMAHHGARMENTFRKNRSLTELITQVKLGFLDVVDEFPEQHQALMCLRVAEITTPDLITHRGPERTIHEALTTNCQLWLNEVEQVQQIRWEISIHDLAAIEVGATYGLVLDYLSRRDRASTEKSIRISAYNLAQSGRRRFKNAPT